MLGARSAVESGTGTKGMTMTPCAPRTPVIATAVATATEAGAGETSSTTSTSMALQMCPHIGIGS